MSELVRRILRGHGAPVVISENLPKDRDDAPVPDGSSFVRDFILGRLGRPEIEVRYEQAFAQKLRLKAVQCWSIQSGPFIKIEIQFDLPERLRMQLSRLYFVFREVAQSFQRQLVPRSALMELTAGAATLTFMVEPLNCETRP